VEVHTGVPDRFAPGMRLQAVSESGNRRELTIAALWPHKGYLVLKFEGIDSISDAEVLVRAELQVSREQRAALEPGWTYVSDLVGCAVFDRDHAIGTVQDVQFGAGEAPLLIVEGDKEYEIPFAEAYLRLVDLESKRITLDLPQGMLEVNAPLSDEEKRQQREEK
jgi:16S rRNA processing protein RimM